VSVLFLEVKYARMLGPRLDRWVIKKDSPFHGNSRCPVCGDSYTNKAKKRFHIIERGGVLFCKCFNCDYTNSLVNYLKAFHTDLFNEFLFEKYRVEGKDDAPVITTPNVVETRITSVPSLGIQLVSELDETHACRVLVRDRQLPDYPFMYAPQFFKFASKYFEDFDKVKKDEARLIIPFLDKKSKIYAFQGRDLSGKSDRKYITVIVNKKMPLVFGIDRIDVSKTCYIVEGPLDSLFVDNCLAAVNSGLTATAKRLSPVINKTQVVLVYDNEPRNPEIVKQYKEAIADGYKIVIWPASVGPLKDINDMKLAGVNFMNVIKKNTFSGVMASLEFQKWKKV